MKEYALMTAVAIAAGVAGAAVPQRITEIQESYPTATVIRVTAEEGFAAGRDKVRKLKAENGGKLPAGGVFVEFADGVYSLTEPVVFTAEDTGTPEAPVLYVAEHPGLAKIDGGLTLDWRPLAESDERFALIPEKARAKVTVADLPKDGKLPGFYQADRYMHNQHLHEKGEAPIQIYQCGRRLPCARWPNFDEPARIAGLGKPAKAAYPPVWRDTFLTLTRTNGERADYAALAREPDLWTHGEWHWYYASTCAPVQEVNVKEGGLKMPPEDVSDGYEYGLPAFVLNAFTQLDEEGEWAVDREHRKLYLWPRRGDIRVAWAEGLIRVRGASDITFEGFAFRNCRDTAVRMDNCRDVILRTSEIRCTSRWGVEVEGGRGCLVQGCDLYELGEGGIGLHGGNRDTLTEARHVADNNHIHHYGQLLWNYNPGVRLEGTGCRATHNLIHHTKHQAFTYNGSLHYVGFNIAHDYCMSDRDAGGIYCYHTDDTYTRRGNVIEYNTFFHSGHEPNPEMCEAIYIDAFTSGITVRGNIVNFACNGIFSSGGQDNLIERNVLIRTANMFRRWNLGRMGGGEVMHPKVAFGRESRYLKPLLTRLDFFGKDYFTRRFPNMVKTAGFEDPYFAQDALFCRFLNNVGVSSGPYIIIDEEFTHDYTTCEGNVSFDGDPGFVDYMGMNWELRDDSPARKTLGGGTRFGEMGLYESPIRFSKAVKWGAGASKPQPLGGPLVQAYAANARVDLELVGKLPEGETDFATDLEGCWPHPFAPAGTALVCGFDSIDYAGWRTYTFSFTPKFDCTADLWLAGYAGAMTAFDDVTVEGAEGLVNGSFGTTDGWDGPRQVSIAPGDGTPFGGDYGIRDGHAFTNDRYSYRQTLTLKKGRRVTISYRASAR